MALELCEKFPGLRLHSRAVWSLLAVTMRVPSGLYVAV